MPGLARMSERAGHRTPDAVQPATTLSKQRTGEAGGLYLWALKTCTLGHSWKCFGKDGQTSVKLLVRAMISHGMKAVGGILHEGPMLVKHR